ncbi:MAG: histidine kinase [Chitinophagales bacterium]|nr:histidine kinase [Chitinophagales bacterium]
MSENLQASDVTQLVSELRAAVNNDTLRAYQIYEQLKNEIGEKTPVEDRFDFYRSAANVHINRHEYDAASAYLDKSQKIAEKENNEEWKIMTGIARGVLLTAMGQLEKATLYFDDLENTAKHTNHFEKYEAHINMRKGIVYGRAGKLQDCLRCYLIAIKHFDEIQSPFRFSIRTNLLTVYLQLKMYKELDETYAWMNREIHLCEMQSILVFYYANYGVYLNEQGKHNEALSAAEKALQYCTDPKQWSPKSTALRVKADALMHLGKTNLSYLYRLRCLDTLSHTQDYYTLSLVHLAIADQLYKAGKGNKANTFAQMGYQMAKEKHIIFIHKMALELLANRKLQEENFMEAANYFKELTEVKEELFNTERAKAVSELQTKYEVAEKEKEAQRLRTEVAEYNLRLLRSQMNPHFIFNSINSINNYVLKNESGNASDYLIKFAQLMRQILEYSSQTHIPLQKEIDFLENYLLLERLRFNIPFDYQIIISNNLDTADIKIPPMLLQPYIENAIWHGLSHKPDSGKIIIEFTETTDSLLCRIDDNGVGRIKSKELLVHKNKHESKAMHITEERITKGLNGSVNVIDLYTDNHTPCGTRVELNIPL